VFVVPGVLLAFDGEEAPGFHLLLLLFRCSKTIILINPLTVVPFLSASCLTVSKCSGDRKILTFWVFCLSFGLIINTPLHLCYMLIICSCYYHVKAIMYYSFIKKEALRLQFLRSLFWPSHTARVSRHLFALPDDIFPDSLPNCQRYRYSLFFSYLF